MPAHLGKPQRAGPRIGHVPYLWRDDSQPQGGGDGPRPWFRPAGIGPRRQTTGRGQRRRRGWCRPLPRARARPRRGRDPGSGPAAPGLRPHRLPPATPHPRCSARASRSRPPTFTGQPGRLVAPAHRYSDVVGEHAQLGHVAVGHREVRARPERLQRRDRGHGVALAAAFSPRNHDSRDGQRRDVPVERASFSWRRRPAPPGRRPEPVPAGRSGSTRRTAGPAGQPAAGRPAIPVPAAAQAPGHGRRPAQPEEVTAPRPAGPARAGSSRHRRPRRERRGPRTRRPRPAAAPTPR